MEVHPGSAWQKPVYFYFIKCGCWMLMLFQIKIYMVS